MSCETGTETFLGVLLHLSAALARETLCELLLREEDGGMGVASKVLRNTFRSWQHMAPPSSIACLLQFTC